MSRTIRKNKFGNKYLDGKKERQEYYCNCWICTGSTKQDLQRKKDKFLDEEIKENYYFYLWDEYDTYEEVYETLDEIRAWINYQEKFAA